MKNLAITSFLPKVTLVAAVLVGLSLAAAVDELGMIHCYPDDPAFRDVLATLGIQEGNGQNLDDRDYVQVDFKAQADAEEDQLMRALGMALLPES